MIAVLIASMVLASTASVQHVVSVASTTSAPQVVAISPTEGAIPANTLRLYVTFDRPARGMVATRDLRLVDAEGRTVDGAFMDFGQDLWSPDGRRLTVLFDPGRVKQDVEGDGDSAAPLRPGLSYTVEVGRKHFHYRVTPALRTPVNPQTWGLALPNAGSREALKITFDREMDAALLRDQLGIVDDQGDSNLGGLQSPPAGEPGAGARTMAGSRAPTDLSSGAVLKTLAATVSEKRLTTMSANRTPSARAASYCSRSAPELSGKTPVLVDSAVLQRHLRRAPDDGGQSLRPRRRALRRRPGRGRSGRQGVRQPEASPILRVPNILAQIWLNMLFTLGSRLSVRYRSLGARSCHFAFGPRLSDRNAPMSVVRSGGRRARKQPFIRCAKEWQLPPAGEFD